MTGRYKAMQGSDLLTGAALNLFSEPAGKLITFLVEAKAANAARKIPGLGQLIPEFELPPNLFGGGNNNNQQ